MWGDLILILRRRWTVLGLGLLLAAMARAADAAPVALRPSALPETVPNEIWDFSGTWRVLGGYRDNVEMSALSPTSSGFVRTEMDFLGWHLPPHGPEWQFFGSAAWSRFASDQLTDTDETVAFAEASMKQVLSPEWQFEAALNGFYLDQYLDLSVSDAVRTVAKLRSLSGAASLALRQVLSRDWWWEMRPEMRRDRYHDQSDDAWEPGARVGLGWDPGDRLTLALTLGVSRRSYDHRAQYALDGTAVSGTRLAFRQREGELRATWQAGEKRQHRLSAVLLGERNADNGSGYFSYRHTGAQVEWNWRGAQWHSRVLARGGRFHYSHRAHETSSTAAVWRKKDWGGEVRLERRLSQGWVVLGEYIAERSQANNTLADYTVNTVMFGVEWTP